MKLLIVGYGSIGKRHEEVLKGLTFVDSIDIVTQQKLEDKVCYSSLTDVKDIRQYDYFVIANETDKHFETLSYIDANVFGKMIFVEKPLFETKYEYKAKKQNSIVVGYVLRFHPVLKELKEQLQELSVYSVTVYAGQYLPSWRKNRDYRTTYSAKQSKGGGVLLDLSHEIDYLQWLFGVVSIHGSVQAKVSDLEIDSDDVTTFIGMIRGKTVVNVTMDYLNTKTERFLIIHTDKGTFNVDLLQCHYALTDRSGETTVHQVTSDTSRNGIFNEMHRSVLNGEKICCSLEEALSVMDIITTVQKDNR